MAKYKINVPSTGGTVNVATFLCSTNISVTKSSGQDIVSSTGATGGKVTIDCNSNSSSSIKEAEYTLSYKAGSTDCSHTLHLVQAGGTPSVYNFKLAIKNDSSYITDFTDITLTVYSPTPETITVLNDLSGVPAGTTSQEISYTASTEGNTVVCVCVVKNTKYPGGEIKTIPCYGFCDVGGGNTVTFRYDNTV